MIATTGQILTTLDRKTVLARHRIADATGLTRATVSKSVQSLIDRGILVETEKQAASARGGPRPTLLRINPDALNFIGLDIRREKFTGVLVDLGGNMVASASRKLAMGAPTQELLGTIDAILDELRQKATGTLSAIGIGSVGPIVPHEGTIQSRHFTALNGVPLVQRLTEATGLPVDLRTGAVAAAHGEERIAASQSVVVESVVFVVIDYAGIGVGLTSGGEGWITDHGGVGELGHVSIDMNGRPCNCGRRGCLLQYASGQALLEDLGADPRKDPGGQIAQIAQDADAGDAAAQKALLRAGEYLGVALVDVDRILRPERMIIGAPHLHLADWYLRGALTYIDTLPEPAGERSLRSRIHLTSMGSEAIAYGAAALQLKNFLADPERQLERIGIGRKTVVPIG